MRDQDLEPVVTFAPDLLADDDTVQIIKGRPGVAVIMPGSMKRLTAPQMELVSELQECATIIEREQLRLERLVAECREEGVSWGAIGWSIGLTDRGAAKRFGPE